MHKGTRFILSAAVSGLALTFAVSVHAADVPTEVSELVVTSRMVQPIEKTGVSITRIPQEELQKRGPFILDALRFVPGVTVNQSGAFGGQASVRMRGLGGDQVLVLVDGIAVNDISSPDGAFDFSKLLSSNVDCVEVLRGPQSTLWGSQANAGVINVVTKAPKGFEAKVRADIGSYSSRHGAVGLGYGTDLYDVRVDADYFKTRGISKADSVYGNPEKDPFNATRLSARGGINPLQGVRIEGFLTSNRSRTAYDSWWGGTPKDSPDVNHTYSLTGQVSAKVESFKGKLVQTLSFGYNELKRRDFGGWPFGANGDQHNVRYLAEIKPIEGFRASLGAEGQYNEMNAGSGDKKDHMESVFALGEYTGVQKLTLNFGLRNDNHSRFGDHLTGRLAGAYALTDALTVRASFGQGFKAPTLYQLSTSFNPKLGPNLDLNPEESTGYELGLRGSILNKRVTFDAAIFQNDVKNQIVYLNGRYENLARTRSKGFELGAGAKITDQLSSKLTYTYTDAKDRTTGKAAPRVPEHQASAELAYQVLPTTEVALAGIYTGKEPDVGGKTIKEWTRLDLTARHDLTKRVTLNLRVENLGNVHYQSVYGYGMPRRAIFAGVEVKY